MVTSAATVLRSTSKMFKLGDDLSFVNTEHLPSMPFETDGRTVSKQV